MRRERGQLTLGVAVGFAMALAIFGLVLRSGLVLREKMKLQQTSDFAALVAADTQRIYLNRIRELNRMIDEAFNTAQTLLSANPAPCATFIYPQAGLPPNAFTVDTNSRAWAAASPAKSFGTDELPLQNLCNGGCQEYDKAYRGEIILAYLTIESQLFQEITTIVLGANQKAYEKGLETFLTPANLPFGLRTLVERKYNGHVTKEALLADYNTGDLSEILSVIDTNSSLPLFQPKVEMRTFTWVHVFYPLSSSCDPLPSYTCCGFPTVNAASAVPGMYSAPAKIAKDGKYETSFLAGATYTPPESVEQNFGLYYRQTAGDKMGEKIQDVSGQKIQLFTTQTTADNQPSKQSMMALSLAKPYDGTFPKAAAFMNPFDSGDAGKEFKGAKLIGIADKAQIGGVDLDISFSLQTQDVEGETTDASKSHTEDFLH